MVVFIGGHRLGLTPQLATAGALARATSLLKRRGALIRILPVHEMSSSSWTRPASVPFPSVWRTAKGRIPMDGAVPSFVVQDVPTDRHEDVLDFMEENYVRHEPIRVGMSFWNDALSTEELRQLWARMLQQNVSLVAFLDDGSPRPQIVGANVLGVVKQGEKKDDYQYKGESIKKILRVNADLYVGFDPFKKYGVEEYITAMGLAVAKRYRGQGIGLEVLEGRMDLGRALGIKLTVTMFTAIESQALATKLGFEVVSEIVYEDYKVDGKLVFPVVNSKSTKLMAKVIDCS